MTTLKIELTDEQARRLRMAAERRHVPETHLLREAVDQLLADEVDLDDEEVRRKARSIIGMVSSGTPDLAERHDDYFVEAIES